MVWEVNALASRQCGPNRPTRPASLAAAGRRPTYPSHIRLRVERSATRHGAAPAGGLIALPRPARRRADLHGRSEPEGPSITEGQEGGIKTINSKHAFRERTEISNSLRFDRDYIRGLSDLYTLLSHWFYTELSTLLRHVATCLFDPALLLFALSARLPVSHLPSESAFSDVRVSLRPATRCVAVVRSPGTSAPCCLRLGGAAVLGTAASSK